MIRYTSVLQMATRRKKRTKRPGLLRAIVAANLSIEMGKRYGPEVNVTAQTRVLGKAIGISPETIRRILIEEGGATIDTLELIAEELDIPPSRLFAPSDRIRRKLEVEAELILNAKQDPPVAAPVSAIHPAKHRRN